MVKESSEEQRGEAQKPSQSGIQGRPARSPAPFEEMDRLMNTMLRNWLHPLRPGLGRVLEGNMPAVDVVDRTNEVAVRAEVPGVRKEDLDVSVSDNTVTLRGTTRQAEEAQDANYYRSEIVRGEFSRTVALPAEVDSDNARATFRDGILELTLPKLERSKRRNIKVE